MSTPTPRRQKASLRVERKTGVVSEGVEEHSQQFTRHKKQILPSLFMHWALSLTTPVYVPCVRQFTLCMCTPSNIMCTYAFDSKCCRDQVMSIHKWTLLYVFVIFSIIVHDLWIALWTFLRLHILICDNEGICLVQSAQMPPEIRSWVFIIIHDLWIAFWTFFVIQFWQWSF